MRSRAHIAPLQLPPRRVLRVLSAVLLASLAASFTFAVPRAMAGGFTEDSNVVVADVPSPPAPPPAHPSPEFTIEKLQRIAGQGGFTKQEVQGVAGQTVEYEIIVENSGNVPLALRSFTDINCEGITGGAGELAPGASTMYSCQHALPSKGTYVNVAALEADPPAGEGPPVSHASNMVVAGVARQIVKCAQASGYTLEGAAGPKRNAFTVSISAGEIQTITFYLDGHRLRTLHESQAKKGRFQLTVKVARLAVGKHTVTVTTVLRNPACKVTRTAVFVKPSSGRQRPPFTG